MEESFLSDLERAEYYRKRYLSRGTFCVIVGILCFVLGFMTAYAYYKIYVPTHNESRH